MMTGVGVLLGTAAYMSPEQARGKVVDKRSDIWAFGCVLYEMLTGRPAFQGEDIGDTLANVVKTEPDWAPLPDSTPTNIRLYSENDIRRILWIRHLTRERGVNLAGIRILFELEERLGARILEALYAEGTGNAEGITPPKPQPAAAPADPTPPTPIDRSAAKR